MSIPASAISLEPTPLGEGRISDVFRARYANDLVCVKRFKVQSLSQAQETKLFNDIKTLAAINHPRIVRVMGSVVWQDGAFGQSGWKEYGIIVEYIPVGTLRDFYLASPISPPPLASRLSIALDIATGMEFLHKSSILHRKLTSKNILLVKGEKGMQAKISDHGLDAIRTNTLTTGLATKGHSSNQVEDIIWMAPELHKLRVKQTTACDVFSFGVVLSELESWTGPFTQSMEAFQYKDLFSLLSTQNMIPDLSFSATTPPQLSSLITQCLSIDPSSRPTFSQIVKTLESILQTPQPSTTTSPNVYPPPVYGAKAAASQPTKPSPAARMQETTSANPFQTSAAAADINLQRFAEGLAAAVRIDNGLETSIDPSTEEPGDESVLNLVQRFAGQQPTLNPMTLLERVANEIMNSKSPYKNEPQKHLEMMQKTRKSAYMIILVGCIVGLAGVILGLIGV
ncbi:hypothetical protein HDU97_007628 [Phlyctochytrium planicorne]|nr:hypothetical protein HDU97_007628 [Phlyctochytrium planicorne]